MGGRRARLFVGPKSNHCLAGNHRREGRILGVAQRLRNRIRIVPIDCLLIAPSQLIVPLIPMGVGVSWDVSIPIDPAFTGLDIFVQGLAANPSGVELSNGVRVEICP